MKLTEEDRKRLALKKKEQASKLSWNDGDGEGAGMRTRVNDDNTKVFIGM